MTKNPEHYCSRCQRLVKPIKGLINYLCPKCGAIFMASQVEQSKGEASYVGDDVQTRAETAVATRRTALTAMPLHEVRHEFESDFRIYPDARSDKDNLIDRILVKVRAEIERHS